MSMRHAHIFARRLLAPACLLLLLALPACSKKLPRDTPAATIASARQVVLDGHANQLADFLWADDPEMKKLYARVGRLLLNIQKLGTSINAKFPDAVADLKAKAEQAAKDGKSTGLLAQMSSMMPQGNRRNRGFPGAQDAAQQEQARKAFDDAIKRFFADPYAFLRESDGKLATISMGDDIAALTWEDKPVLPPIGMVMRKDIDNRWYFVLPTNLPGISNLMPKTKDQYQILGGLVQVFDNVVIDLRKDVDSGVVHSMDELARRAGEKAFVPAAIAFFAYAKYQDDLKAQPSQSSKPDTKAENKPGGN